MHLTYKDQKDFTNVPELHKQYSIHCHSRSSSPHSKMALDDVGMHRAGLGFIYRITPVLVATILYGIYLTLLCIISRGLWQRGFKNSGNSAIFTILYILFGITTAIWGLEVAQLIGLDEILLNPQDLSTDDQFAVFYALVGRETKITSILFECQACVLIITSCADSHSNLYKKMIIGDILVIWRVSAVWHNRRLLTAIPLFWWGLMIINMIVCASFCRSGVSSTDYTTLCKVTDVLAPVLSIMTNVSVMLLTVWKAWIIRETFKESLNKRQKNKIFTIFVLLIESGTLYVVVLVTDLFVTSYVTGSPESVGRMIDCISGYSTVQFVAIYPTLMLVILRESVWNAPDDDEGDIMSVTQIQFTSNAMGTRSTATASSWTHQDRGMERVPTIRFADETDESASILKYTTGKTKVIEKSAEI